MKKKFHQVLLKVLETAFWVTFLRTTQRKWENIFWYLKMGTRATSLLRHSRKPLPCYQCNCLGFVICCWKMRSSLQFLKLYPLHHLSKLQTQGFLTIIGQFYPTCFWFNIWKTTNLCNDLSSEILEKCEFIPTKDGLKIPGSETNSDPWPPRFVLPIVSFKLKVSCFPKKRLGIPRCGNHVHDLLKLIFQSQNLWHSLANPSHAGTLAFLINMRSLVSNSILKVEAVSCLQNLIQICMIAAEPNICWYETYFNLPNRKQFFLWSRLKFFHPLLFVEGKRVKGWHG